MQHSSPATTLHIQSAHHRGWNPPLPVVITLSETCAPLLHSTNPPSPLRSYNGGRSLDAFLSFLDGKLKADAGFARVEALDPLAAKFGAAEDKAAVAAEAQAAAAGLSGGWLRWAGLGPWGGVGAGRGGGGCRGAGCGGGAVRWVAGLVWCSRV